MEENKQPIVQPPAPVVAAAAPTPEPPTANLDMNSRVIQPPAPGTTTTINNIRPEPAKQPAYQPQIAAPPPQSPAIQPTNNFMPAYADSTPPKVRREYVAGGIYVIAAAMMLPTFYITYWIVSMLTIYGMDHLMALLSMLGQPGSWVIIGYLLGAIVGMIGGVLLFKQKRAGLIMAMVSAGLIIAYGMLQLINMSTLITSPLMIYSGLITLSLVSIITLQIVLPAGVIFYLARKKVRDFASY